MAFRHIATRGHDVDARRTVNKNITIELAPDEATLLVFSLSRRLDTVVDVGVRDKLRKLIEKVKARQK